MSDFAERIRPSAIRFERHYRANVARVWRALVTPEGVSAWLGRATIDPRSGGAFEVSFSDVDRMAGTILEFEPDRRLVLAWREGASESMVSFELRPAPGGGTHLTLTHEDIREGDEIIGLGAGWHSHLDALGALLDDATAIDRSARYAELRPQYESLFRQESTVR